MAEEVKKSRPAPDPNSAKFKLGQIAAKAYSDAMEAKKRGEMVGWCASNFPVEIPETLGLYVCYPENQAAGIAARGGGERMCNEAEGEGYSNDICAYARISLAYAKLKSAPEQDMPMPDFVLCCNNICNCMIKWYENLAKELNIPMFMIDIPFNPDYEVSDAETEYIKAQFWDVIHGLEAYTGKKWSDERFKEVMASSGRASRAWIEATSQAKYVPSPFNGFDLLNHMAVMVTARGKEEAGDAMETLLKASAIHEISHWCIAGKARRELVDFGYWYCPDGRDAQTQSQFEDVEVKPQALDWLFCVAAGYPFNVSCDNLEGDFEPDRVVFQRRVHAQVMDYLANGIPERPARFIKALQNYYHTPELTAEQFPWPEALN